MPLHLFGCAFVHAVAVDDVLHFQAQSVDLVDALHFRMGSYSTVPTLKIDRNYSIANVIDQIRQVVRSS